MKIFYIILLFIPFLLLGQTQSENYVLSKTYKKPTQNSIPNPAINDANQQIVYFDGLGRPIQKIDYQLSASGQSIITPIEYDSFGRQIKDYLPYTTQNSSGLNFETSALNDVLSFPEYVNQTPFSEKKFDNSPLNKIIKMAGVGNDWSIGSGHEIKIDYRLNSENDVVNMSVDNNGNLIHNGYFRPGLIYKTVTKNENWKASDNNNNNTIHEFKDNYGRVILKRTFNNNDKHDTYYVYNKRGNLAFVLPPKFFDTVTFPTETITNTCNFTKTLSYSSILMTPYLQPDPDDPIGGGGSVTVSMVNGTLNFSISIGCELSYLNDNTNVQILNDPLPCIIPDMSIGYFKLQDLEKETEYFVYIENNRLRIVKKFDTDRHILVNSINVTLSVPVLPANFNSQPINPTNLNSLCYQYIYDDYNRLVEKKLPGKQWEFIVYDKLDRVVSSGPALSPWGTAGELGWMITKYDAFSRPVYTGWEQVTSAITTASRISKQNNYNNAPLLFETKTTSGTIDGVDVNYSNIVAPTIFKLLTVNYYDDYLFPNMPPIPTTVLGKDVFYNNTQKPKGMPTGSWVRVLDNSSSTSNEMSYTLYDEMARPIRSFVKNHLGGYTQVDSQLDFIGKTMVTETRHKRLAASTEILVREDFTYSAQDRLLIHTHKVNSNPPQVLSTNEYTELGQLKTKQVGTNLTTGSPLQKVDYSYNIRGWLTNINDTNNLQQGNDPQDLFGFKINYNIVEGLEAGVVPLYNGNISETFWRTAGDNISRNYGYRYDDLNRLTEAIYQKQNITIPNSFREYFEYDKNGNISRLERNGGLDGNTSYLDALTIDNLSYRYKPNSNQLMEVYDSTLSSEGFTNGPSVQGTDDYSYDHNANMIEDKNKRIVGIAYNHLNLPTEITFQRGSDYPTISYLYNAIGVKLQKIVNPATRRTAPITTNYLSDFQYQNTILQFFPHAEGYVNVTLGTNYNYVYNYTDHLGNVRLSYGLDRNNLIKVIEENNYYPFGLKHSSYNTEVYNYAQKTDGNVDIVTVPAQNEELMSIAEIEIGDEPLFIPPVGNALYNYRYNSKEYQDELGLNLYDYGARNYDQALGRWMNIDPLAEKYFDISAYTYVGNDPINYIDPDGMDRYYMNDQGRTILALKEDAEDILFFGGKDNKSIVDTNKDGKQNSNDGVNVKTKGLLKQLTIQKGETYSLYTSTVAQSKTAEDDMLNIFHFAANNAEVEFSLKFYEKDGKNLISLGTFNSEFSAPGFDTYGKVKANKAYHNHPYNDIYTPTSTEENSMGYYGKNKNRDGDSANAVERKTTHPNYVFFPKTTNLYNLTLYRVELVKKINGNYKNLKK